MIITELRHIRTALRELAKLDVARFLNVQDAETHIRNAMEAVKFATPRGPCLPCNQRGCDACKGEGWLPLGIYERVAEERDESRKTKKKGGS